jgi:hypothetical protein
MNGHKPARQVKRKAVRPLASLVASVKYSNIKTLGENYAKRNIEQWR